MRAARLIYHEHTESVACSMVPGPLRNYFGQRERKFQCPVCGHKTGIVNANAAVCSGKVITRRKRS